MVYSLSFLLYALMGVSGSGFYDFLSYQIPLGGKMDVALVKGGFGSTYPAIPAFLGVISDPTTKGLADSTQAMGDGSPKGDK